MSRFKFLLVGRYTTEMRCFVSFDEAYYCNQCRYCVCGTGCMKNRVNRSTENLSKNHNNFRKERSLTPSRGANCQTVVYHNKSKMATSVSSFCAAITQVKNSNVQSKNFQKEKSRSNDDIIPHFDEVADVIDKQNRKSFGSRNEKMPNAFNIFSV